MKNANLMQVTKNVLKNARMDKKQIVGGACYVCKQIWLIAEQTENNGVRAALALAGYKDRQKLIDDREKIAAFGHVGETRANGSIIRFSDDLVLRWCSALHTGAVKAHNKGVHDAEKAERAARKAAEQAERERKQAEKAKAKADAEKRHSDKEKARKARETDEKASKAA